MNMKKFNEKLRLSRLAFSVFKIGLPIVVLALLYILFNLITIPENDRAWLYVIVPDMMEYGIMSFTLIVCGGLFTDMVVKNTQNNG